MSALIRNDETVEPGTFVRWHPDGTIVYEVIKTRVRFRAIDGMLRDTRNGWIIGWRFLDAFERVARGS